MFINFFIYFYIWLNINSSLSNEQSNYIYYPFRIEVQNVSNERSDTVRSLLRRLKVSPSKLGLKKLGNRIGNKERPRFHPLSPCMRDHSSLLHTLGLLHKKTYSYPFLIFHQPAQSCFSNTKYSKNIESKQNMMFFFTFIFLFVCM